MYKVLVTFTDPEHHRVYYEGGQYPAEGCTATEERIKYLSSNKNKAGTPVIAPLDVPSRKRKGEGPKDEVAADDE